MVIAHFLSEAGKACDRAAGAAIDLLLGFETRKPVSHLDYAPVRAFSFFRALRRISPGKSDTLLDVGCGKGRALAIAALFPLRRILGVELDRSLAGQARKVSRSAERSVLSLCRNIEVAEGDATARALPDDVTILFLFNPFGEEQLSRLLEKVQASLARRPRELRILYFAPVHHETVLAAFPDSLRILERAPDHVTYLVTGGPHQESPKSSHNESGGGGRELRLLLLGFVATMGISIPRIPLSALHSFIQFSDLAALFAASLVAVRWPGILRNGFKQPVTLAAGIFVFCTALSAFALGNGWPQVLGTIELLFIFLLASSFAASGGYLRPVMRTWVVAASVLGLLGFIGLVLQLSGFQSELGGHETQLLSPFRLRGLSISPNMLASLCLVPLLALLSRAGKTLFPVWPRMLLACFLSFVMVFTVSRTLLALMLGLLLLQKIATGWKVAGVFFIAGLAFLSVRYQWVGLSHEITPASVGSLRWEILSQAAAGIKEAPLLGKGPGSWAAEAVSPAFPEAGLQRWDAHNTFLSVAVTTGIPSLLVFLVWILLAWSPFRTRRDAWSGFLRLAVAVAIFDALTVDVEHFRHLWLLLGLSAGHGFSQLNKAMR